MEGTEVGTPEGFSPDRIHDGARDGKIVGVRCSSGEILEGLILGEDDGFPDGREVGCPERSGCFVDG